ncbi:hypothetical protein [Acidocella facilis]|uniref:hypothetical protein n=1 Tax=Acidocella facilis TaxID=525 RepID=UPI001F2FB2E2|nr:hypothetical protein [Acidocella facilis]
MLRARSNAVLTSASRAAQLDLGDPGVEIGQFQLNRHAIADRANADEPRIDLQRVFQIFEWHDASLR